MLAAGLPARPTIASTEHVEKSLDATKCSCSGISKMMGCCFPVKVHMAIGREG